MKQGELTQQNQECTRLNANLTHVNQSLKDERTQRQEITEQLHSLEQQSMVLKSRLIDKETVIMNQNKQLDETTAEIADLTLVAHSLRLELITAQVKLETQNTFSEQFRELMHKPE